jgi:hypothetical protein
MPSIAGEKGGNNNGVVIGITVVLCLTQPESCREADVRTTCGWAKEYAKGQSHCSQKPDSRDCEFEALVKTFVAERCEE